MGQRLHVNGKKRGFILYAVQLDPPAAQEIDEHVPERLKIVAPALLAAQVRVDAHVPCGAGQAFVLPIGNVFARVWINILFRQAKI